MAVSPRNGISVLSSRGRVMGPNQRSFWTLPGRYAMASVLDRAQSATSAYCIHLMPPPAETQSVRGPGATGSNGNGRAAAYSYGGKSIRVSLDCFPGGGEKVRSIRARLRGSVLADGSLGTPPLW
jgi:hypothetical protein